VAPHPRSPHYGGQFPNWLRGEYPTLPLDRAEASRLAVSTLALEPL
jgi:acyl-homoserine lactone acylase PvdQ